MNTESPELTKPWPDIANRAQWSRILGIPIQKLQYEERMYRLSPIRDGFNVLYKKDEIMTWLRMTGRI
jgi:hypothetical protein